MQKIPVRHFNQAQKEPDFSGSFSIRDLDILLAGNDMVQELHRHDFHYILALKRGVGKHAIDFIPYTVSDYSIFLMRPGQVHELMLEVGCTGYLLQFRDDFYYARDKQSNELLRKAGKSNYHQADFDGFEKLLKILTNISEEYIGKQEGYQEVIKANLGILFIELIRLSNRIVSDKVNLYTQERLETLLSLIEINIFSIKSVSDYASLMNLSAYQLNTITQKTLGKTCSEVINEHIILEAKRFLLATSNQINQIADHLGYDDVSYFIRFFKKHTGHSPESFRQNFKGVS
jgi:AraC-like DNA-binding protein